MEKCGPGFSGIVEVKLYDLLHFIPLEDKRVFGTSSKLIVMTSNRYFDPIICWRNGELTTFVALIGSAEFQHIFKSGFVLWLITSLFVYG